MASFEDLLLQLNQAPSAEPVALETPSLLGAPFAFPHPSVALSPIIHPSIQHDNLTRGVAIPRRYRIDRHAVVVGQGHDAKVRAGGKGAGLGAGL